MLTDIQGAIVDALCEVNDEAKEWLPIIGYKSVYRNLVGGKYGKVTEEGYASKLQLLNGDYFEFPNQNYDISNQVGPTK